VRWLVHGTLTPAVAEALKRHGDAAQTMDGLSLAPGTSPAEVLKVAQKAQLDVMTDDALMIDTLFADDAPPFGRSVVYVHVEGGDVEQDDAVDRLFARYKRLAPGRLYTVTGSRVKVRQLPGKP
jgi:predicted nuclease of predicted toxin-antitoxin system